MTTSSTRGGIRAATAPLAPPGRREAAKAAKRARILQAGRERFRSQGYEATTMAQIADDADVAIGTVFQYAATKAELLMMVTADHWADRLPHPDATVSDPVAAIRALVQPFVDTTRLEPDTSAAIARELLFGADGPHLRDVEELVAALEAAVVRVIEAHQPPGSGPAPDAAAAARLVVSGCLLEVNRSRLGRRPAAGLEDRLTTLIRTVLHGTLGRG